MLKPVCNCGRLLADIELEYEAKKEEINQNIKLTDDEIKDKEAKLLDYFELNFECCRSQVLGYVDLIKIIVS